VRGEAGVGTHQFGASPKLLLSVCVTQKFTYSATRNTALLRGFDVSLIYDQCPFEGFVVEYRPDRREGAERPSGVSGVAQKDQFNCLLYLQSAPVGEKMTNSRELETYLVHTQAESSTFSSLSTFPKAFKGNITLTIPTSLTWATTSRK